MAESLLLGPLDDTSTKILLESNQKQIELSAHKNAITRDEYRLSKIYKKINEKEEIIHLLILNKKDITAPYEKNKIDTRIQSERKILYELNQSFLRLSLGSSDLSEFSDNNKSDEIVEVSFQKIIEPLTNKLMKFTEKPRKIEKLLSETSHVHQRIEFLRKTLSRLKSFKSLSSNVQIKIDSQISTYQEKELLLLQQLDVLESELEKIQFDQGTSAGSFTDTFLDFVKLHGLTIVYALMIFIGTYILLSLLKHSVTLFFTNKKLNKNQIFTKRLLNIFLTVISIIIATGSSLAVIYSRSDWLIFAIVLFIIFLLIFSLKNYLPKMIRELKFILNIGIVREGEIVKIEGILYKVKKIGLFALLENPLLSNARTRLSLTQLENFYARESSTEELLFPTQVGDYVFIEALYGKIVFQSPSIVTLEKVGGSQVTYPSNEFILLKPENISSHGFAINITISFGYKHQQIITTSILSNINRVIKRAIVKEDFYKYLKQINIEFNEAKIESLDLVLISFWDKKAANIYPTINRTMRKILVDMANSNGWTLPYPQLEITTIKFPTAKEDEPTKSSLLLSDE